MGPMWAATWHSKMIHPVLKANAHNMDVKTLKMPVKLDVDIAKNTIILTYV